LPQDKRLKLPGHRALQIPVLPFGHETERFPLPGHLGRQRSREPFDSTPRSEVATPVSPYVRNKLFKVLPTEEARAAVSALEAATLPLVGAGSRLERRIHLAIVKLVCDPWTSLHPEPSRSVRFRQALELAQVDWRDLLVSAGLEHDNWPQVLTDAGYEAPEHS